MEQSLREYRSRSSGYIFRVSEPLQRLSWDFYDTHSFSTCEKFYWFSVVSTGSSADGSPVAIIDLVYHQLTPIFHAHSNRCSWFHKFRTALSVCETLDDFDVLLRTKVSRWRGESGICLDDIDVPGETQ